VDQEDSGQYEVDGMKKGADSIGNAYVKERLVLDKVEYSAFGYTLNSAIVSYRNARFGCLIPRPTFVRRMCLVSGVR